MDTKFCAAGRGYQKDKKSQEDQKDKKEKLENQNLDMKIVMKRAMAVCHDSDFIFFKFKTPQG